MNPYIAALEQMFLFLTAIVAELLVAGALVLVFVYGYSIDPYAIGGLLCCAVLLGWWGYFHGRGPGPDRLV